MSNFRTIELSPNIPPLERRLDVVRVVIPNEDNDLLLVQRSMQCKNNPGLWEFPGGKVDPKTAPEHTATNEILEEIGLELPDAPREFELVYRYQMKDKKSKAVDEAMMYCGWSTIADPIPANTPLQKQESEVSALGWMSEASIRRLGLACLTPMAQLQLKIYRQQSADMPTPRQDGIQDLITIAA